MNLVDLKKKIESIYGGSSTPEFVFLDNKSFFHKEFCDMIAKELGIEREYIDVKFAKFNCSDIDYLSEAFSKVMLLKKDIARKRIEDIFLKNLIVVYDNAWNVIYVFNGMNDFVGSTRDINGFFEWIRNDFKIMEGSKFYLNGITKEEW